MKGFIIKNTKTGKVYTGKVEYVNNPDFNKDVDWVDQRSGSAFGASFQSMYGQSPPKLRKNQRNITDADKEKWPIFYKKSPWTYAWEEYATPFGSDGTTGPPWKERVANYWGTEPKVFTTKKAAQKILSTITQTYYKDRENETTALLYLPDHVHDFKIVAVEVTIKEVEDGTGIATTSSEPTKT